MRKFLFVLLPLFSCHKETIDKRDCKVDKYIRFPYIYPPSEVLSSITMSDGINNFILYRNQFIYSDTQYFGVINDTCIYYTFSSNSISCLNCGDDGKDINFHLFYLYNDYFSNYIKYPIDLDNNIWDSIIIESATNNIVLINGHYCYADTITFNNSPYVKSILFDQGTYGFIYSIETKNGRIITYTF